VLPQSDGLVGASRERKQNNGWVPVLVQRPHGVLFARLSPSVVSTVHGAVIGTESPASRFTPVRSVPASVLPDQRPVASALRSLLERCVALVPRTPRVCSVASRLRRVGVGSVALALQSSPRVVLTPALQVSRRAALARKCTRILGRLAHLATGQPRQRLQ